jgi:hypothetical protein
MTSNTAAAPGTGRPPLADVAEYAERYRVGRTTGLTDVADDAADELYEAVAVLLRDVANGRVSVVRAVRPAIAAVRP